MNRIDGSRLRLQLMERSSEERREAKHEARDLRSRALELSRDQVAMETVAERENVRISGWKSLGNFGGEVLRIAGVLLSTATYGVSAAVGEICAQGITLGTAKGFEGRELRAAAQRRNGGALGAQGALLQASAERLDETVAGTGTLNRSLASAEQRIQRELRRALSAGTR